MLRGMMGFLDLAPAPLALMAWGWHLGQLHQSGYDLAGIVLFTTGAAGLVLALLLRHFTKRFSWHGSWFAALLTGAVGCGLVFALLLLLVRLHG